ncbi:MAG: phosphate acyltransferase PlsX [Proteobacteria bacterium]|nr:phosphate acyltransferase PlsX [Pseudomonadota bacterium]
MIHKRTKIAVDAMGGDFAPRAVVDGAVNACREYDVEVILTGRENIIRRELKRHSISSLPLTLCKASEVIGMGDNPLDVVRKKKDSSIRVGMELLNDKKADAFVSAGNSGAVVTAALFVLKRIKGIDRPAIATILPTLKGNVILIDAGANNSCKPYHLAQFAIMSSVFSKYMLNCAKPRIGVLSNGEEESKGTDITRDAHALLRKSSLNYIGYIEGKDVFKGTVDIVVCDGFTGNILLKVAEGTAECLSKALKEEIGSSLLSKLGYLLAKKSFSNFKKRFDYSEYGGALLLGITGPVVISHGRSSPYAIKNAIRVAKQFAENKIIHHLTSDLEVSQDLLTFAKKPSLFDRLFKSDKKQEQEEL